ncbi:MAG: hypothetical protein IKN62_07730 [Elusimicrobia bacterium]|nr:hypothetical protein [Elusimicrobiota bacterium]
MKRYKLFLISFLIFSCSFTLFAENKVNSTKQTSAEENKSVAYLGLERDVFKQYRVTGNVKKDRKYNEKVSRYIQQERERLERLKRARENSVVYDITGMENKFSMMQKDKNTFDIDGREIYKYSKKLSLTKYQKAQVDYLEMERKSKISSINKEISYRRKLLDEELAKEMQDVFIVEDISREIKILAADRETVNINVDKKIRYVLDSEQYLIYKRNIEKKNKEK